MSYLGICVPSESGKCFDNTWRRRVWLKTDVRGGPGGGGSLPEPFSPHCACPAALGKHLDGCVHRAPVPPSPPHSEGGSAADGPSK